MRWLTGVLLVVLVGGCAPRKPILCYVGPNMRDSMTELGRVYEARTGAKVIVESDEVRSLIGRIGTSRTGDIFVTHDPFLAMLAAKGIVIRDAWTVASVRPMIAVPKGNPRSIMGLQDLARPGLRVGLTDLVNSISGQIITLMLEKAGITQKVKANVVKQTLVGRDIADVLIAGQIDACIVWNVVIFSRQDKIEAVDIRPEWRPKAGVDAVVNSPTLGRLELDYVRVTIATLGHSNAAAEANAFAEFVASPQGKAVFAKNGFSPPDPSRPTLPKQ
jgi:molybdate transport system substrate-binding protein